MEDKQKLLLGITNCLLGSYIRIREIHWNTRNQATHNLTNTLLPEIIDYIDSTIELMSGTIGRPGYDILKPIIPSMKELKPILQALVAKIETCQDSLDGSEYRSLNKVFDDLTKDLVRWIYLSENF